MTAPHLLHVFSTFAPGGPQVRTVRLMAALGDEFRHSVVALDGRSDARELLAGGLDVTILDPPPRAGTFRTLGNLNALYARLEPDAVLTYNWGAIEGALAARLLARLPLLHHEDGFRPDELAGYKWRRVVFRRWVLKGAQRVIVPSERLYGIATGLWKLSPQKVRYVPNGIRLEDFPPRDGNAELRAELGIPADAVVFGAVGHLRGEKNFPRLVRAFGLLDEGRGAHLVLLGDGEERGAIEAQVAELGLGSRVHLCGHVEDLAPHYRAMDVFVISSDTEQMPVSLLEAMSAELPAVSTDVGDVARMLAEGHGALVVPLVGDSEADDRALGAALGVLLEDADLRSRLGSANRVVARERYSFEGMVSAYRESYRALLES